MSNFQKAFFFDRDGVINQERKDYVKTLDELEIFPNFVPSVKFLKEHGYLVFVITNQSAINRGLTTHYNVEKIHNAIQILLNQNGTYVDHFYFCPHRPEENCICRKPKSGLILQALKEFNIDLSKSYMIGDNDSDVLCAKNAGCKGVKIKIQSELLDIIKNIVEQEN